MSTKPRSLGDVLQEFSQHRRVMQEELQKVIVGQDDVIEQIFAAIFTRGHCLLVGVPGLAKTLMVSTLARILDIQFKRIQFTPDLMPSDITGTNVLEEDENGRRNFRFVEGPIFTNILLADEINRTPPKTQAALIEAMEEKQVTIDGISRALPDPFIVFATQNPLEHQGTYPLPEAQLDRFMLKVLIGYPARKKEKEILENYVAGRPLHDLEAAQLHPLEGADPLREPAGEIRRVTVEDSVADYILDIIAATREDRDLYLGASPRAAIHLLTAARILAALRGKAFVTPDEVKEMCKPVLRHRLVPVPEAEVEGLTNDDIIEGILSRVKVPR